MGMGRGRGRREGKAGAGTQWLVWREEWCQALPPPPAGSARGDLGLALLLRAGPAAAPPGRGRQWPASAGRAGPARSRDLRADGAGAGPAGGATADLFFVSSYTRSQCPPEHRKVQRQGYGQTHPLCPSVVWPRGRPFLSGLHPLKRFQGTHIWPSVPRVKSRCLTV